MAMFIRQLSRIDPRGQSAGQADRLVHGGTAATSLAEDQCPAEIIQMQHIGAGGESLRRDHQLPAPDRVRVNRHGKAAGGSNGIVDRTDLAISNRAPGRIHQYQPVIISPGQWVRIDGGLLARRSVRKVHQRSIVDPIAASFNQKGRSVVDRP